MKHYRAAAKKNLVTDFTLGLSQSQTVNLLVLAFLFVLCHQARN